MAIDWVAVGVAVEGELQQLLKEAWDKVASTAGPQVTAMVQVGADIERQAAATPPTITPDGYAFLKLNQQRTLETVLATYEAIGAAMALRAAASAWAVIEKALAGALPFPV